MHETKTPSPNTKRDQSRLPNKVLPVGKPCCLSTPALHRIAGAMAQASRLFDVPRFSPYHPVSEKHTSQVQPPGDNECSIWVRATACGIRRVQGDGRMPGLTRDRVSMASLFEFPFREQRRGVCMPASNSCQRQSAEAWWEGRGRRVGSLGIEPYMTNASVRPR